MGGSKVLLPNIITHDVFSNKDAVIITLVDSRAISRAQVVRSGINRRMLTNSIAMLESH